MGLIAIVDFDTVKWFYLPRYYMIFKDYLHNWFSIKKAVGNYKVPGYIGFHLLRHHHQTAAEKIQAVMFEDDGVDDVVAGVDDVVVAEVAVVDAVLKKKC